MSGNAFEEAAKQLFGDDDSDAGVPTDPVDAGLAEYQRAHDAGVGTKVGTPAISTPDSEDPVIKRIRADRDKNAPQEIRRLDPDKPTEGGWDDYLEGVKHTLEGGTYTLGINDALTNGMNTVGRVLNARGYNVPYADHTIDGKPARYAGATPSHTVREKPVEQARERHPEHTAQGEGDALLGLTYGASKFIPAVAKYIGGPPAKRPRLIDGEIIPKEPGKYTQAYRGAVKAGKKYVKEAAEDMPKTAATVKAVGRSAAGLGAAAVARGGQIEHDRASQVIDEFTDHPYQTALMAAGPVVIGGAAGTGLQKAGQKLKDKANIKVATSVADARLARKLEKQGGSEAYKKLGKQMRDMGLLETSMDANDHSWARTTAARISNNIQRQKGERGAAAKSAQDAVFNSSTGRNRTLPDGRVVPEKVGDVALPTQGIRNKVQRAARGYEEANAPASEVREIRKHLDRLKPRPRKQPPPNRAPLPANSVPLKPMDASVRAGVMGQPPPPPPPQTTPVIKLDLPSSGTTGIQLGGPARGNSKYRGSAYKGQPAPDPALGAYPHREPPDVLPPATQPETPAGHMPLGGTGVGSPGGPQRNAPKPTEPQHYGLHPDAPSEVPVAMVPYDAALRQWEQEQELSRWNLGEQPPKHLGTQPQPYVAQIPRFQRQSPARGQSRVPDAPAPSPTAKPQPRAAGTKPTYTSKLTADPSKTKASVRNYGKPKKAPPEPNIEEEIKDFQLEKPQLLGPANPPEWPQVVEPNKMKLDLQKLAIGDADPGFQEMAPTAPRINLSPHEQRNEKDPPRLKFPKARPTVGIPQPMKLNPPFQAPLGVGQAQPQNRNVPFQAPSLLRPPDPEILPYHNRPKGSAAPPVNPAPRFNLMPTEQRTGPGLDVPRLQLNPKPFAGISGPNVPISGTGPGPQLSLGHEPQPQIPTQAAGALPQPQVGLSPFRQSALRTRPNFPSTAKPLPAAPTDPTLSGGYSSMYQPKTRGLVEPLSLLPENRQLPASAGVKRAPSGSATPDPEHFTLRQGDKVQRKLMDDLINHTKPNNRRARPGEDAGKRPIAYGLNQEKLNLLESMKDEGTLIPELYDDYRKANRDYSTLKDIEDGAAAAATRERRGGDSVFDSIGHRLLSEQRSLHRYGSIADSIGSAIKSPSGALGLSAGVSGYRGSKQSGSDYREANEQMKKDLEEELNGTIK